MVPECSGFDHAQAGGASDVLQCPHHEQVDQGSGSPGQVSQTCILYYKGKLLMNPHVKQLVKQAGLDYMPDHDLEKFAELLIRECATVANCPSSFKQTNGYKILRHFGLEEQLV